MSGDPAVRRTKLQAMADEYVVCRAYGHAWDVELLTFAMVGGVERRGYRTEARACTRCGTQARTVYDGQLGLLEQAWMYAAGYLLPAGAEVHYRTEAMAELWTRAETRDRAKPKGKRRSRPASHPVGSSRRRSTA